jgi:hypothetical protein
MTRRGLRELRLQIDRVLAGYVGGGWAFATYKGKVSLRRVRSRNVKPEVY